MIYSRKPSWDAASFLVCFSVFYAFIFEFVDSKCPKSFPCGDLGELAFPLTDYSQPECGLLTVECHAHPVPKIHLDTERLSPSYEIVEMISLNQAVIRNHDLELLLNNKSCGSLYNLSVPQSTAISFSLIFPNNNLFKCFEQLNYTELLCRTHWRCLGCPEFEIYYTYPNKNLSATLGCESLLMPIKWPSPPEPDKTELFDLLSSEYHIAWKLTDDCTHCHKKGGYCTSTGKNEFRCEEGRRKLKVLYITGATAGTVVVFFMLIFTYRCRKNVLNFEGKSEIDKDIELFLENHGSLPLRRYKYSDLKKMTNSFSDKLGEGGFASVHRGKLKDGLPVAVKILKESKGNGEEFINEVVSISRTSHVNVVKLLGFSSKGSKRALIYEFMPNGSLEKFINNNSSLADLQLGWEKMFQIAVGIARGIEYLHQGCNTRILHFDIKPHNILLDKDFNPKVSDFGLAKLCPNRSSIVSMLGARGTIGYIAPEIVCRNIGGVSHKSDVYSYGMMVLEMAGQRQNSDARIISSSEKYFPEWIYKNLEHNAERDLGCTTDASESLTIRKMVTVGLWCIQTDPKSRPSMSRVIEMLEGNMESLQLPPKPHFTLPSRLTENPTMSEFSLTFSVTHEVKL